MIGLDPPGLSLGPSPTLKNVSHTHTKKRMCHTERIKSLNKIRALIGKRKGV